MCSIRLEGEYRPFQAYLQQHGIQFRHPCPHTHAQHDRADCKHRHIIEMSLALLAHSTLPLSYWWEATHTAVFIINRLPTNTLHNLSPYQVLYHRPPDYSLLRTFGCACFPCLRPYNKHKLQFRSTKCIFIGYSSSHQGYLCLSPNGRTYISRHVVFDEHDFPFQSLFPPSPSESTPTTNDTPHTIVSITPPSNAPAIASHSPQLSASPSPSQSHPSQSPTTIAPTPINTHPMITRAKDGISKKKAFAAFPSADSTGYGLIPASVTEALSLPVWREAMQ